MPTLLGHLIDQLLSTAAFTLTKEGRVLLLHAHPSFSTQEHREALSTLIHKGFINDFRYIDALPQAAVIAIRG